MSLSDSLTKTQRSYGLELDEDEYCYYLTRDGQRIHTFPKLTTKIREVWYIADSYIESLKNGVTYEKLDKPLYIEKLQNMSDPELGIECEKMIWLSAYANNRPRSEFHWQCSACYAETEQRDKIYIYARAHKSVSGNA